MTSNSPAELFRIARERAGLSIAEVAQRAGVSEACIWDLETHDDELRMCYSLADLQRFAAMFGVRPRELIGTGERDDPITLRELIVVIQDHCHAQNLTLEQFSEIVGWDLTFDPNLPEELLMKLNPDGAVSLCMELGIEWDRFVEGI